MIIIKTDRLVIRESSGRDFSRIYAMMLSVSAGETTDEVSSDEDEELEKFLAYIHNVYPIFGFGLWSVCLKAPEDTVQTAGEGKGRVYKTGCGLPGEGNERTELPAEGELIGRCGLQAAVDGDSPMGRIELGYLIDERMRGRGYGYEACSAIVEYAFRELEIEELCARISSDNLPSAGLARKLGFVRMGPDGPDTLWVLRNPACDPCAAEN